MTFQIKECRYCQNKHLIKLWSFPTSPYGDSFQVSKTLAKSLSEHSMTLAICNNCNLVQLLEITNISEQYDEYLYRSSNTNALGEYYQELSRDLLHEYQIDMNSLIVDIGSNDGTFLEYFAKNNYDVLGIEPSIPAAQQANSKGINTLNKYFDTDCLETMKGKEKISLISINYTLANIPNIMEFFQNLKSIMNNDTLISIVTGYHPDQFTIRMFDYIGHDHLSYFDISFFNYLCTDLDLKLIDVKRIEHKGGSIQLVIGNASSKFSRKSSVNQLIQREKWQGVNTQKYYLDFQKVIEGNANIVRDYVKNMDFRFIYGVGASISTTYLINVLEIGDKIKTLFDDDLNKIGKFNPKYGIEVKPLSELPNYEDAPVIILAWQHTDKLLERLKSIGNKKIIILPFPELKVL
jgi:SAM-dependent methyltransferase